MEFEGSAEVFGIKNGFFGRFKAGELISGDYIVIDAEFPNGDKSKRPVAMELAQVRCNNGRVAVFTERSMAEQRKRVERLIQSGQ